MKIDKFQKQYLVELLEDKEGQLSAAVSYLNGPEDEARAMVKKLQEAIFKLKIQVKNTLTIDNPPEQP